MSAIFSECGKFRYRLERDIKEDGIVVAFLGINPSTANTFENDPTVRKWIGFSKQLNAKKILVGNIFNLVTPDTSELAEAEDLFGPENQNHIHSILNEADLIVACWGSRYKVPKSLHFYFDEFLERLCKGNKEIYCYGTTQSGDPKHVGRISYKSELVKYTKTN